MAYHEDILVSYVESHVNKVPQDTAPAAHDMLTVSSEVTLVGRITVTDMRHCGPRFVSTNMLLSEPMLHSARPSSVSHASELSARCTYPHHPCIIVDCRSDLGRRLHENSYRTDASPNRSDNRR